MAPAQRTVEPYGPEAFQADRATMRFRGKKARPTEDGLVLKRELLTSKASPAELPAIEAAFARLMAWARSGAPVPGEPPTSVPPDTAPQLNRVAATVPEPDPAGEGTGQEEEAASVAMAAAWAVELDQQQARHRRRRGRFEAVRPQPPA